MQKRTFGRRGRAVSPLCFGAWQLGGTWGDVSRESGIDTLHCAFDHGINMVDTAAAYGAGRSEEVVGAALDSWSGEEIFVATKVLPVGRTEGRTDLPTIRGQYPPAYVRREVEASLRRLRRDHIDLLQLHLWVADGLEELDWLAPLLALIAEGKVREIGVSLPDMGAETGIGLARTGLVSSIQTVYNIFDQGPVGPLFDEGRAAGTSFIARVPFDSGALTGTWTRDTHSNWDAEDKRAQMYDGDRFDETLRRIDAVKAVTEPLYDQLSDAALQFCLSDPAVTTIACGMRSCAEVEMNVRGLSAPSMPDEMRASLTGHAWAHAFY